MKTLRSAALPSFAFLLLAACNSSSSLPQPIATPSHPIQHVVILLQENRSFNNLFRGFPGADTASSGKCQRTQYATWCPPSGTVPIKPYRLEGNGTLGAENDIAHDHEAFEKECDPNSSGVCQMDGLTSSLRGRAAEVARPPGCGHIVTSSARKPSPIGI